MATQKHRITISLPDDISETLKGLAAIQGLTMSGLVVDYLWLIQPTNEALLDQLRAVSNMSQEARLNLANRLRNAERKVSKILGELEGGFMPQPPHSNTGVTSGKTSVNRNSKSGSKPEPARLSAVSTLGKGGTGV